MSRDDQKVMMVVRNALDVERVSALLTLRLSPATAWEVTVAPEEDRRTIEQNKRYHAIVAEIADQVMLAGKRYHPDVWKEQFKRMFIGTNETALPDGTVLVEGISTARLKKGAFSDYMMEIEAWAANHSVRFSEPATRYLSEWRATSQRGAGSRRFT